jgi:GH25 family lysozyme M1 (1,4-beta-N-acetylmuramidase)
MNKIKAKGYTPMLYSSKYFLLAHVQLETILKQFGACLWVAGYRDMNLATTPDYRYFPSLPGVAIWQFTSNYVAGGLDGNVDLLGVTHKGYIANKPTQKHVTQKNSKPQTKSSKSKNRTKGVHKPYLTSLLKKFFVLIRTYVCLFYF